MRPGDRRLILVVDGLDERAHETAPIGPQLPDAMPNLTVVVSTRPQPSITSYSLPASLLRNSRERTLTPTASGFRSRDEAMEHANQLIFSSDEVATHLVGFLAVSRTGLTYGDLAELTESDQPTVGRYLRPLARLLTNEAAPGGTPRYALAHVELSRHSLENLGTERVRHYTDQLRIWVDRCRSQKGALPAYAFDGYVGALLNEGELDKAADFLLRSDPIEFWKATGSWTSLEQQLIQSIQRLAARANPGDLTLGIGLWLLHERVGASTRAFPDDALEVLVRAGDRERARLAAASIREGDQRSRAELAIIRGSATSDPWTARDELLTFSAGHHLYYASESYGAVASALADSDAESAFDLLDRMSSMPAGSVRMDVVSPWCRLAIRLRELGDERWRDAVARAEAQLADVDDLSRCGAILEVFACLPDDDATRASELLTEAREAILKIDSRDHLYSWFAVEYLAALTRWSESEALLDAQVLYRPDATYARSLWAMYEALRCSSFGSWKVPADIGITHRLEIYAMALQIARYESCSTQSAILAEAASSIPMIDEPAERWVQAAILRIAERACIDWCLAELLPAARRRRWPNVTAKIALRLWPDDPSTSRELALELLSPTLDDRLPALQHLDSWRLAVAKQCPPSSVNLIRLSSGTYLSAADIALAVLKRIPAGSTDYPEALELTRTEALRALRTRFPFEAGDAKRWIVELEEATVWAMIDEMSEPARQAALAADVVRILVDIDVQLAVTRLDECVKRFGQIEDSQLFWRWGVEGAVEEIALKDPSQGKVLAERYHLESDEVSYAIANGERMNRYATDEPTAQMLVRERLEQAEVDSLHAILAESLADADGCDISAAVRRLTTVLPQQARSVLLHALSLGRCSDVVDILVELAPALEEPMLLELMDSAL